MNQQILKTFYLLISTYYSNLYMYTYMRNTVKSINQTLKQSPNESTRETFGETQIVLSLKQPLNLLRFLSNARLPQALFNCNGKIMWIIYQTMSQFKDFK